MARKIRRKPSKVKPPPKKKAYRSPKTGRYISEAAYKRWYAKPVRKPARKPVRKPARKPVRKPARKPARKPTRKPVRKPRTKSIEKMLSDSFGGRPIGNPEVIAYPKAKTLHLFYKGSLKPKELAAFQKEFHPTAKFRYLLQYTNAEGNTDYLSTKVTFLDEAEDIAIPDLIEKANRYKSIEGVQSFDDLIYSVYDSQSRMREYI